MQYSYRYRGPIVTSVRIACTNIIPPQSPTGGQREVRYNSSFGIPMSWTKVSRLIIFKIQGIALLYNRIPDQEHRLAAVRYLIPVYPLLLPSGPSPTMGLGGNRPTGGSRPTGESRPTQAAGRSGYRPTWRSSMVPNLKLTMRVSQTLSEDSRVRGGGPKCGVLGSPLLGHRTPEI